MQQLKDNEVWIKGFEGTYSISTDGVVTSYKKKTPTVLRGAATQRIVGGVKIKQYPIVLLSKDGKSKCYYVHRLVAEAFLPNQENKVWVSHLDGVKTNNNVENLEWMTSKESSDRAWELGFKSAASNVHSEEKNLEKAEQTLLVKHCGYKKKFITDELLSENGIPPEIKTISCVKDNYLETWKYYLDLFYLCDQNLSLAGIQKITGLNTSHICRVRAGKRGKKARAIYDKYKNDPLYTKGNDERQLTLIDKYYNLQ